MRHRIFSKRFSGRRIKKLLQPVLIWMKEAGKYMCHVNLTYVACNPRSRIEYVKSCCNEPFVVRPEDLPPELTVPEILGICAGVLGFFIIIFVIILVVVIVRRKRKQKPMPVPDEEGVSGDVDRDPYPPLRQLLQETEHVLDFGGLKMEASRLISMKHRNRRGENDEYAIFQYLQSLGDQHEEEGTRKLGGLTTVHGCRCEKLENRKDTQVLLRRKKPAQPDVLHMTKLFDYYGDELILCQAPMPNQFADHWEAVWQEKVGVIVWLGGLIELGGRRKIDAYIALEEGAAVQYDSFVITTNLAVHLPGEYDAYWTEVKYNRDNREERRELIVMHVHMWPDHQIPEEPAKLADLVLIIQKNHFAQSQVGLPTVMCHCSLGVQRSPSLLAVYIARQMWLREHKVNIHGILRYIRRHRWRAFAMGNPFAQVQIIFGIVQVIATRKYTSGLGALKIQEDEHASKIFDPTIRRQDYRRLRRKRQRSGDSATHSGTGSGSGSGRHQKSQSDSSFDKLDSDKTARPTDAERPLKHKVTHLPIDMEKQVKTVAGHKKG